MLNRVILMGRLTADPELRKTASDLSVTSLHTCCGSKLRQRRGPSNRLHQLCCLASNGGIYQQIFFQRQTDGSRRFHSGSQLCGQE